MANTDVTIKQLTINAQTEYAATAATATGANTAEIFDIAPTKRDGKFLIIIDNVAADQGSVTWSLAAGDFWAGTAALTGTIAQGKKYAIEVETAKYLQSDGKLNLTVTPASGKILLTNHTLTVGAIQLS
jgi:hypothetical protein